MPQVKGGPPEMNKLLERVYQDCMKRHNDERRCSTASWTAIEKAGWRKNKEEKWVKDKAKKKKLEFEVHNFTPRAEGESRSEGSNDFKVELIKCGHCGADIDWAAEPEVAMGAVKCPKCGAIIDQEGTVH